ncbi:transcriptional regulator [Alsobacter soli]|uniref:transcriptional regulator n=1 Tax=Alsobacter soli TaxID=2109933 RepID=UPI0011B27213|nr:transcriptional regulator [Alsobacter soli]
MFVDEIRRAVEAAPRNALDDVARLLWRAFANGQITEDEAEDLGQAIEARKVIPAKSAAPRRRVGSRPRSPESMERRRRWAASGRLPPALAASFTLAEQAVLAVISMDVAKRGDCRLTVGHIAALAGCCVATVRTALRQAADLGLVHVEERRLTCWRNLPNVVTIVSAEWRTWLRLKPRQSAGERYSGPLSPVGGGSKSVSRTTTVPRYWNRREPPKSREAIGKGRAATA